MGAPEVVAEVQSATADAKKKGKKKGGKDAKAELESTPVQPANEPVSIPQQTVVPNQGVDDSKVREVPAKKIRKRRKLQRRLEKINLQRLLTTVRTKMNEPFF